MRRDSGPRRPCPCRPSEGRALLYRGRWAGDYGTPAEIARLFSVARPMISSKLLRLPTRGALGNGLRVAAGCVLASNGNLTVITRNCRIRLRPERDGSTSVVSVTKTEFPVGTRIEIGFGPSLARGDDDLYMALAAIAMAQDGIAYKGRLRHAGTTIQLPRLLSASHESVRKLIASLDGCTGGKAGEIVETAGFRADRQGGDRGTGHTAEASAREYVAPVNPKRLGMIGALYGYDAYAFAYGTQAKLVLTYLRDRSLGYCNSPRRYFNSSVRQ